MWELNCPTLSILHCVLPTPKSNLLLSPHICPLLPFSTTLPPYPLGTPNLLFVSMSFRLFAFAFRSLVLDNQRSQLTSVQNSTPSIRPSCTLFSHSLWELHFNKEIISLSEMKQNMRAMDLPHLYVNHIMFEQSILAHMEEQRSYL